MLSYFFVLSAGLIAGLISGVIGTGSSIILLPILVFTFGPKQAVPIMAVAAVMANFARVAVWWKAIDWRAFAAYSVTGIPAAAIGARTLLALPPHLINIFLGLFFIAMIPTRHRLIARGYRIKLWQLSVCGAAIGFLTGVVLSTGPLSVPAFTAYGLMKGAFISTEAASSLMLYVSKVLTFGEFGALPPAVFLQGIIVGSSLMAGTFMGKVVMLKMSDKAFSHLLDALLLCSGLSMLWAAL